MPSSEPSTPARAGTTTGIATLLLADARLPVGGHTVSSGLEAALLGGMPEKRVTAYLRARLATVTRVEAGTAVVASAAVRHRIDHGEAGAGPTTAAATGAVTAAEVAWAWAARTPLATLRESSVAQGRAVRRLLHRLRPDGEAAAWIIDVEPALLARPLVLGALAAELGLDGAAVARLVGYDDVQSVASAALKLLPLDPADPVAWVLSCAEDLELLVQDCAGLTRPHEIPAHGAPQLEAWHAAHATASRRLFRA